MDFIFDKPITALFLSSLSQFLWHKLLSDTERLIKLLLYKSVTQLMLQTIVEYRLWPKSGHIQELGDILWF